MPAFGAMLRRSSQALFFEVTTQKTDKSQAVGERGIPPFKERRVGHPALRFAIGRATRPGCTSWNADGFVVVSMCYGRRL
jgi:hypothetical protein